MSEPIFYKIFLTVLALGAMMALLSPYFQMRAGKFDGRIDTLTARRHLLLSGFVLAVTAAAVSGFSFAGKAGNVIAVIAALISYGALALFSFRAKPNFIALPVGILSLCAWLLALLYLGVTMLFTGNSSASVALDEARYCRETVYGFVTGDSGEELEIFQRYLFIDHSLYRQTHSDVYSNEPTHAPAKFADAVSRCQTKIDEQRAASIQPSVIGLAR